MRHIQSVVIHALQKCLNEAINSEGQCINAATTSVHRRHGVVHNGVCVPVSLSPVGERQGVRGRSSGPAGPHEAAGQPGCRGQRQAEGGSGGHPGHRRGLCFSLTSHRFCEEARQQAGADQRFTCLNSGCNADSRLLCCVYV